MNYLDIIICLFLIFGLFRGFIDGFFVSLASLVGLIAGIYGAIHFSHYVAEYLADMVSWSEQKINLAAFAITFIIIVVLIFLAGKILTQIANFAALGIFNKILGAVFGIVRASFILSVIILFLNSFSFLDNFIDQETRKSSVLYAPVEKFAPAVLPTILKETEENEIFKTEKTEESEENQK